MALSSQNQNLISELQDISATLLSLRAQIDVLVARWNQNDVFNLLTDEDVAAVFPHLTKSEVANAITAVTAVNTALGDLSAGQAVNLIKMKG